MIVAVLLLVIAVINLEIVIVIIQADVLFHLFLYFRLFNQRIDVRVGTNKCDIILILWRHKFFGLLNHYFNIPYFSILNLTNGSNRIGRPQL